MKYILSIILALLTTNIISAYYKNPLSTRQSAGLDLVIFLVVFYLSKLFLEKAIDDLKD